MPGSTDTKHWTNLPVEVAGLVDALEPNNVPPEGFEPKLKAIITFKYSQVNLLIPSSQVWYPLFCVQVFYV